MTETYDFGYAEPPLAEQIREALAAEPTDPTEGLFEGPIDWGAEPYATLSTT